MQYVKRGLHLPASRSFFLFGARNTGKSTLLRHAFGNQPCLWLDLLDPDLEERYSREPISFKQEVAGLDNAVQYVIIDEIQKVPKLLDSVHQLIESTNKIFIMTGSSARKLKYGGANLLAGRASVYNLFPLTSIEIGKNFDLNSALQWGMLLAIVDKMSNNADKASFLQAYAQICLKEEIWLEQFIRKIDPFRKFLEVCAQCNGQILNLSNISKDVGVDDKTIKQYFSILENTLMGFTLEPYLTSFRKRLHSKPKFYYFDIGVCRALSHMLSVPIKKSTSYYGDIFDHFIILECVRLASYYFSEYRFPYIKTKNDVELDLVVERPGEKLLCIEIKSTDNIREEKLFSFAKLVKDIPNSEAICISDESRTKKIGEITILPWKIALQRDFTPSIDS
jgi:predicted AAA+ superfamily ATPase